MVRDIFQQYEDELEDIKKIPEILKSCL